MAARTWNRQSKSCQMASRLTQMRRFTAPTAALRRLPVERRIRTIPSSPEAFGRNRRNGPSDPAGEILLRTTPRIGLYFFFITTQEVASRIPIPWSLVALKPIGVLRWVCIFQILRMFSPSQLRVRVRLPRRFGDPLRAPGRNGISRRRTICAAPVRNGAQNTPKSGARDIPKSPSGPRKPAIFSLGRRRYALRRADRPANRFSYVIFIG
jgi:hypothetical protein